MLRAVAKVQCVGNVMVLGRVGVECGGLGGGVCGECDGVGESGSEVWRSGGV